MKVVGMILVVLIVIGLIAAGVWYFKFRRTRTVDESLVTNEDILLEGMGTKKHQPLDSGSEDDSSSLGSSGSWDKNKNIQGGSTKGAKSLSISSSSDEEVVANNLL